MKNGNRSLIFYSCVPDEPPGFKMFREPETIHCRKKSSPTNINFHLEDDDRKSVDFNGEIMIFTLLLMKNRYKLTFNNMLSHECSNYTVKLTLWLFLCL